MIHQIKRSLLIKNNINTVWGFASNPYNLKKITPDYMNFKILNKELSSKIYEGMIIEYTVSPILKIPLTWVTEITHIKEKMFFVDEQRVGPYKMWHHEHIFEIKKNGVMMTDIITYIAPFYIFGNILNKVFLKKQLNSIFDYREMKMNDLFNRV